MNTSDCPALGLFDTTKNSENDTKDQPEDQIVYTTQNTIENEVSHPNWDQTEDQKGNYASNSNVNKLVEYLSEDQIDYQPPNQINLEAFDPNWDQTDDQKEKDASNLNVNKPVQDSSVNHIESNQINPDAFDPNWDQTGYQIKYERSTYQNDQDGPLICLEDQTNNETYFLQRNNIRVANIYGRFPCNYCHQTFKTEVIVRIHEKKSCKGGSSYQNDEILANENGRLTNQVVGRLEKKVSKNGFTYQKYEIVDKKRIPCESCNQTFSTINNMKRHKNTASCKAGNVNQKKRFPCSNCNETFSGERHKTRHENNSCKARLTNQNENETFQCKYCAKKFNSRSNANRHEEKSCKNRPIYSFEPQQRTDNQIIDQG